jgi:hypothetical protein
MVPVVSGELRDDLVDVYVSRPGRPLEPTAAPGPLPGSVLEALEGWLVKIAEDGSAEFKGVRLSPGAMDVLKLCDGTRRIRDIASEFDGPEEEAAQREAAVVRLLFPLMRTGRLLWRPEPWAVPA